MIVILTTVTNKCTPKTVSGTLLQDGLGHITALVTNKNGKQSIKRFSKEKYTYTFIK